MATDKQNTDMADFKIRNMSQELLKKLKHRAVDDECSINELVIRLLEEALKPKK
jgi:plasmid stability protein